MFANADQSCPGPLEIAFLPSAKPALPALRPQPAGNAKNDALGGVLLYK